MAYSHSSGSSESSDLLDLKDEQGWVDVETDQGEQLTVVCLFDDLTFADAKSMIKHCIDKHGFDLQKVIKKFELDFYGQVKLINYIRSEAKTSNTQPDVSSAELWEDDQFLQPVLADDALLFSLDDIMDGQDVISSNNEQEMRIKDLEQEIGDLQLKFADYQHSVKALLDKQLEEKDGKIPSSGNGVADVDGNEKPKPRDDDSHYFSSYSYNDIHETMLKDEIRTNAYRDFIYLNKNLFSGKVVLDIGCGTGILSMFCAKAGAKKVIAVDNSAIIHKAREIVFDNTLDHIITCVYGKIEEVTLPVDKVDIIVSEWMGYCLLYEAMLDSVLWARDRYLAPGGLMVPSHCTLWLAPVSDSVLTYEHTSFWHGDVYGFNMSSMAEGRNNEVAVRYIQKSTMVGTAYPFLQLPLGRIKVKELSFTANFETMIKAYPENGAILDGFAIWFDTFFLPSPMDKVPYNARAEDWEGPGIAFTTGPYGPRTHWEQGLLMIDRTKTIDKTEMTHNGQIIKGTISYKKADDNSRALEIEVQWGTELGDAEMPPGEVGHQMWLL